MKLTKKQQNGLLLVLYVSRSGRCRIADVAEELQLSPDFLVQISRELRRVGILQSFRGSGGGFELSGEPTVGDVLYALGALSSNPRGFSKSPERRALSQLFSSFASALTPVLKRKVRSLNLELAANETAAMVGVAEATVN